MDEENGLYSLSPSDRNLISRHGGILTNPEKIRLVKSDDDAGVQLDAFCTQLEQLIPEISVKREMAADNEPSGIHVSQNLHFRMVPRGQYLELFLLSLFGSDTLAGQEMGVDVDGLEKSISLPAMFTMYVTENCPFCSIIVPKGLFLAGAAPSRVDMTIIDAMMFPAMAEQNRIRSVPTTIMDGMFRWSGDFDLDEVIETVSSRDPMKLGYETLKKIISDGDAEGVADLMDRFNEVIPAYIDLLIAEKWPERLGAMVAFEYLTEKNRDVAKQVIDILWGRFDSLEPAIMGDVLHLVGVFNQPDQSPRLQAVLSGKYPEPVKKVAGEILHQNGGRP